MESQDEFDVVVVVFMRSEGVDADDAEGRAQRAITEAVVKQSTSKEKLQLPVRAGSDFPDVRVARVAGFCWAGPYGSMQFTPNDRAYRSAGLGPPRRAAGATDRVWLGEVQPEPEP